MRYPPALEEYVLVCWGRFPSCDAKVFINSLKPYDNMPTGSEIIEPYDGAKRCIDDSKPSARR